MGDQHFLSQYRLQNSADFERVFSRRRSTADENLVIYGRENGLPYSRIGLVVSRKVGGAVARNRWKRLMREAFRIKRCDLPVGVDWVIIPRQGTKPELKAIAESLLALMPRVVRKLKVRNRQ